LQVRFQKKGDKGKALRGVTASLLRTILAATMGGFVVHRWHAARQRQLGVGYSSSGRAGNRAGVSTVGNDKHMQHATASACAAKK
jgi:hypothetical protein